MKHPDLIKMRRRIFRGITMVIGIVVIIGGLMIFNHLNNDPDWKWFHYNVNITE